MSNVITKQQMIDGCVEITERYGIHKLNSNTVSEYFKRPYMIVYKHFKGFDELIDAVIKTAFEAGNMKIIGQIIALGLKIPRGYDDIYTIEVKKL